MKAGLRGDQGRNFGVRLCLGHLAKTPYSAIVSLTF